jgi:hypothetical protein
MTGALRFCKCGHVEGMHMGDYFERECQTEGCDCTRLRPKKSGSRIKRFLTGR